MDKYIKILMLFFMAISLSACKPTQYCSYEPKNIKESQGLYLDCLKITAEARKGQNYSTKSDEDWEDVVSECGRQSRINVEQIKVCR